MAVPGDEIVAAVSERDWMTSQKWIDTPTKPKWPMRGKLLSVEKASEHRADPACKFFGACGGCRTQHVAYIEQLQDKQRRIETLFEPVKADFSPGMELREIVGVQDGKHYNYRNKTEFTCSTGRWLLDDDRDESLDQSEDNDVKSRFPFTVGFFPLALSNARRQRRKSKRASNRRWSPRILSIDECALQDNACNRVLKSFVAECEAAGIEAYNFNSHQGFLKQVVLRRGTNASGQTEIMLGLVTTTMGDAQSEELVRIVNKIASTGGCDPDAQLVSVIQRLDMEAQRHRGIDNEHASAEVTERVLFGQAYFEDTLLNHRFHVSFDSFFQPNSAQASLLYREVQRELALAKTPPVVWDLFCGVGSIGICMGSFARKVVGFEIVPAAVKKAEVNASLNGYSKSRMQFYCADLTQEWPQGQLDADFELPDVVIVDPPRAGLHKKLIKFLRRLAPRQICYISCNPNTQVDDIKVLCREDMDGSSYRVCHLQPVDMLPHTPHIETVAWLERI